MIGTAEDAEARGEVVERSAVVDLVDALRVADVAQQVHEEPPRFVGVVEGVADAFHRRACMTYLALQIRFIQREGPVPGVFGGGGVVDVGSGVVEEGVVGAVVDVDFGPFAGGL